MSPAHRFRFPRKVGLCFALAVLLVACGEEESQLPGSPVFKEVSRPADELGDDAFDLSWDSEGFQDAAHLQLEAILSSLKEGGTLEKLVLDPEKSVCRKLRPPNAEGEQVFQRDGIDVLRWSQRDAQEVPDGGLDAAYADLAESWPKDATPRVSVQHQAKWRCQWQISEDTDDPPRLVSVQMVHLEEIRSAHGGRGTTLVDVTTPLLGGLSCFRDSLNHDANYWITRLPRLKHRFQHGIGVGDVDADGVEDFYLCQPEGLPNILLVRQTDGSVRDAAPEFGLDFKDTTTSALFADFDNDGDQDLAVAFRSPFDLFENVNGTFERRFSLPHLGQIFSLAAADYDSDGLLDLYICRYQNFDDIGRARNPIPLHDARNGGENALLKNLGDWKFEDTTKAVGLDQNNDHWSMAASWEDYDNDGDLDLYVANDYGRNNLYRCDRASDGAVRFEDIAEAVGVEDMTTSMGVSWGDPNRDGIPDIYVSNMYSSAGRRITYQKNFKRTVAGSDEAHIKGWQRAAMGNSLFQRGADGSFRHVSAAAVQKGLWSWGTVFADVNHDGWEDLLVTNGFVTGPAEAPDL